MASPVFEFDWSGDDTTDPEPPPFVWPDEDEPTTAIEQGRNDLGFNWSTEHDLTDLIDAAGDWAADLADVSAWHRELDTALADGTHTVNEIAAVLDEHLPRAGGWSAVIRAHRPAESAATDAWVIRSRRDAAAVATRARRADRGLLTVAEKCTRWKSSGIPLTVQRMKPGPGERPDRTLHRVTRLTVALIDAKLITLDALIAANSAAVMPGSGWMRLAALYAADAHVSGPTADRAVRKLRKLCGVDDGETVTLAWLTDRRATNRLATWRSLLNPVPAVSTVPAERPLPWTAWPHQYERAIDYAAVDVDLPDARPTASFVITSDPVYDVHYWESANSISFAAVSRAEASRGTGQARRLDGAFALSRSDALDELLDRQVNRRWAIDALAALSQHGTVTTEQLAALRGGDKRWLDRRSYMQRSGLLYAAGLARFARLNHDAAHVRPDFLVLSIAADDTGWDALQRRLTDAEWLAVSAGQTRLGRASHGVRHNVAAVQSLINLADNDAVIATAGQRRLTYRDMALPHALHLDHVERPGVMVERENRNSGLRADGMAFLSSGHRLALEVTAGRPSRDSMTTKFENLLELLDVASEDLRVHFSLVNEPASNPALVDSVRYAMHLASQRRAGLWRRHAHRISVSSYVDWWYRCGELVADDGLTIKKAGVHLTAWQPPAQWTDMSVKGTMIDLAHLDPVTPRSADEAAAWARLTGVPHRPPAPVLVWD